MLIVASFGLPITAVADDDDVSQLNDLTQVQVAYYDGDFAAALEPALREKAACEKHKAENPREYSVALNNLGVVQCRLGHYADARRLLNEALAIRVRISGKQSEPYASVLDNLAVLQMAAGEYSAAADSALQAVAIRRRALGPAAGFVTELEKKYPGELSPPAAGEVVLRKEQLLRARSRLPSSRHQEESWTADRINELLALIDDQAETAKDEQQERPREKLELEKARPDSDVLEPSPYADKIPVTSLRRYLAYARSLNNLAGVRLRLGQSDIARPLFQRSAEIHALAAHRAYDRGAGELESLHADEGAVFRDDLVVMYQHAASYQVLQQDFQRELLQIRNLIGRQGLQTAAAAFRPEFDDRRANLSMVLGNLASCWNDSADHDLATELNRSVEEIQDEEWEPEHPGRGITLNNQAVGRLFQGDYAEAEPLIRKALEVLELLGKNHPDYATALATLAEYHRETKDDVEALRLHRQVLEIRARVLGDKHPDYAQSQSDVAVLLYRQGKFDEGRPLHEAALATLERTFGSEHPRYLRCLSHLGSLHAGGDDRAAADAVSRRVLDSLTGSLGKDHPDTARARQNLGWLLLEQGDLAAAELLYQAAAETLLAAPGENHPAYADALYDLALLRCAQGQSASGADHAAQAARIGRRHLLATAAVQSQRQQLQLAADYRRYLSAWLATTADSAAHSSAAVYAEVLAWKGLVSYRRRLLQLGRDRAAEPAFAELRQVQQSLLNWSPSASGAVVTLADLLKKQEELERRLGAASAKHGKAFEQRHVTPEQLQAALPPDTALIDYIEYEKLQPSDFGGPAFASHLAAFVVRRDAPIVRIELGALAGIRELTENWLFEELKSGSKPDSTKVAADGEQPALSNPQKLRNFLWAPLSEHLVGKKTVLIAPDGRLGRVPWSALPGDKHAYLLEEHAIAVVAIPQMLPELLAGARPAAKQPSVLLVGGVEYAGAATPASSNRAGAKPWPPLPATFGEVNTIRAWCETRFPEADIKLLRGASATKSNVLTAAADRNFLHFATHGYFSSSAAVHSADTDRSDGVNGREGTDPQPDSLRSRLSSEMREMVDPALFSGLVFAGSGRPESPADDGILSAQELSSLDLGQVELATLSACETALGESAGLEGLIGLQHSFQTAGARSVVATLWKVDDTATRNLMERFYENLWGRTNASGATFTKLEALREAQLYILNHPDAIRGSDPQPEDRTLRTSPRYWAAFTLSGDWR